MYFPYFRGKQYELVAIRNQAKFFKDGGKMIPIIEPVRSNISPLKKAIDVLIKEEARFVLVFNPQVGLLDRKHPEFSEAEYKQFKSEVIEGQLSGYDKYYLGYIVTPNTDLKDMSNFLAKYNAQDMVFIHQSSYSDSGKLAERINSSGRVKMNIFEEKTSRSYRKLFGDIPRVIVEDAFNAAEKNSDYPDSEFFSDHINAYADEGYYGFGDFLIVGREFRETGGPAYSVAIHISYRNEDGDLWVKHFLSHSQKMLPVNPAGKFLEAAKKLEEFVAGSSNASFQTEACREFIELAKKQDYPGLGYVKKLSMQHHLELMNQILG